MTGSRHQAVAISRRRLLSGAAVLALTGCTPTRHAVPPPLVETTQVPGFEHVKFWADEPSAAYARAIAEKDEQLKAAVTAGKLPPDNLTHADFLAISGGVDQGAFAAGLLRGWTGRGTRPTFGVVSGVSAGALAAPFAFLGAAYDDALEDIFTKLSAGDLYSGSVIFGIFGESLYDTKPLAEIITRHATDAFLDEIAAQHRLGRRILIMTTDLDSERPVIWYLSAIAASSRSDRRELFVKVLLASSALPGIFPPVEIPVVAANGTTYTELHVDGGVTAELVFAPPEMKLPAIEDKVFGKPRSRDLYIIRNGKLVPEYHQSILSAVPLASRAVKTMVKYQVIADLRALEANARATGTNFFFNATPSSFDAVDHKPFDPAFARRLYAVGREVGAAGTWSTTAPLSPELVPDR